MSWKNELKKDAEDEIWQEQERRPKQIMGDSELTIKILAEFLLKYNTTPDELDNLFIDSPDFKELQSTFGKFYQEKFKYLLRDD